MSAPNVEQFVAIVQAQAGKPYVFGAETNPADPSPPAFDCAELFEWASYRIGLVPPLPDGTWIQVRHCQAAGTLMPIDEAIATRGALLFKFSADPFTGPRPPQAHVALSLGDGRTFEARSTQHGIGSFEAAGRGWTHAARVPGLVYPSRATADGTGLLLAGLAALYVLTR